MPDDLVAYTAAPLHKAPYKSDVIHGISDVLQSYHLGNDWCAAFNTYIFVIDDFSCPCFRYFKTHNLFSTKPPLPIHISWLCFLISNFFENKFLNFSKFHFIAKSLNRPNKYNYLDLLYL